MGSSGTDISSLVTGSWGSPLRNALWGSQKEPHEFSGVWQAVACSASPHCHRHQAVLLTHVGGQLTRVPQPEPAPVTSWPVFTAVQPPRLCLQDALPHIRAHLHAGRGTERICASVPNSTRQDDSCCSQSQGKSTESTLT